MLSLTVEDGIKSIHQLSDNGSRSIPASGNADKMILTLRASFGGKVEEKKATVKVYGSAKSSTTSTNRAYNPWKCADF